MRALKGEQLGKAFNKETGFRHIRFGKAAEPSETYLARNFISFKKSCGTHILKTPFYNCSIVRTFAVQIRNVFR